MEQHQTAADVAIASLWFGLNYGSILTAWALYDTVESLGYAPVLLHKPASLWEARYNDPDGIAGKFIHAHCHTASTVSDDDAWRGEASGFSTILVGADALWRYDVCGAQTGFLYYLDFAPDGTRKIAYGTTIGKDTGFPPVKIPELGRCLGRFDSISVKEIEEALVLSSSFDLPAAQVLDPVFLPTRSRYEALMEASAAKREDAQTDYIFSYIEGFDPKKKAELLKCATIHKAPLRCHVNINRLVEASAELGLMVAPFVMTEDWLHYLANAKFIVTDSYYGMCFALLFEKPFVVMAHEDFPDLYRFRAVLEPLGLGERLLILEEDLSLRQYLYRKPIRYHLVTPKLEALRQESIAWLKAALAGEQEVHA